MSSLTIDQVRQKVREGSVVLWVYRDNVEDGTVIIRNGDTLDLCWLEGYQSRNDTIQVGDVLAIFDKKCTDKVAVFPFIGKGYLTEAGERWVTAHPVTN